VSPRDLFDVWVMDTETVDTELVDFRLLDDVERGRADRFVAARHRTTYMLSHLALRVLLARHTSLSPQDLTFARESCASCGGPHGRPVLTDPGGIEFSLSHSGHLTLVAIAHDRVGVDIEGLPDLRTVREVAPSLHQLEQIEVEQAGSGGASNHFARIWTRKEAYLKALGIGLSLGLADPYVGVSNPGAHPVGWSIADLGAPRGFRAATAIFNCRTAAAVREVPTDLLNRSP